MATENTQSVGILTTITSALTAVVNKLPTDFAEAVGLFYSARAAITTLASGVASAAVQQAVNKAMATYQYVPLSPSVLATGIVRNVLPDSTNGGAGKAPTGYPDAQYSNVDSHDATAEAAFSGMDPARFGVLVGATGMSYGVLDAIRLYNRYSGMWQLTQGPAGTFPVYVRGQDLGPDWGIQLPEVYKVIAHSDIRPEYSGDLLKLARNPVSPADIVEMVVKQIIDEPTGSDLYVANGGFAEQFGALVQAAGDSMGPEKIVDLLAHGKISYAQAERALGMSRINPIFYYAYIDQATQGPGPVHAKWLSPFEIKSILDADHSLANEAVAWLEADGYDTKQATAWVGALSAGTVAAPKAESMAVVLSEYSAQILTEKEATAALTDLGYSAGAIGYLLQYATAKATIAARNTAMARVRAAYLVGDITSARVTTDLTQLGIPQAAILNYLADWGVEAATPHLHLSAAQVGHLLKEGYIDAVTAQAKWVAMGYSATDAALLLLIYPPANAVPPGTGTPAVTG